MVSKSLFVILLCCALGSFAQGTKTLEKVKSPQLLREPFHATANIFVSMKDGISEVLSAVKASLKSTSTHTERTTAVYKALTAHASQSQKGVLEFLNFVSQVSAHKQIKIQSFWITNQVYIKNADRFLIEALAEMEQVSEIREESILNIKNVYNGPDQDQSRQVVGARGIGMLAEWGLEKMRVPEVWNMGINGTGLIVGNIDTGVRSTHQLLNSKWLGTNSGWYDPEDKTQVPRDIYNHGTHTMGTLVGDNGIGIAPGARWTACKGYRDDGTALTSVFVACGQFMLCPTDTQGNNADCSKAPHVVSNSWGDWSGETYFHPVLETWITAGILASFSAGNTGMEGCTSIYSPADALNSIAVGATGENNELAIFSSLGPSPFENKLKPDISAPGLGVYSSSAVSDSAYMTASGTSMSCPNASGVLALMKAADLNLSHEKALSILKQTANQNVTTAGRSCGGVTDSIFPNNHFGSGVIDAYAAVQLVLAQKHQ